MVSGLGVEYELFVDVGWGACQWNVDVEMNEYDIETFDNHISYEKHSYSMIRGEGW